MSQTFDQSQGDGSIALVANTDGTYSFDVASIPSAVPITLATHNAVVYTDTNGKIVTSSTITYTASTRTLDLHADDNSGLILQRFVPATETMRFDMKVFEATFTSEQDPVLYFGWNLAGEDANRGGIGIEFEGHYNESGVNQFQELHLVHYKRGRVGGAERFLSYKGDERVGNATEELSLGAHQVAVVNTTGGYRVQVQDAGAIGHEYEIHFVDVLQVKDFGDSHVMFQMDGTAINGPGSYVGNFSLNNLYFKDQNGVEALTVWGPDAGARRVMLARGTALQSGGQVDFGLRFSSQSQFGVFVGSGAPTMSANYGSLYLDGSSGHAPCINLDNSTSWGKIAVMDANGYLSLASRFGCNGATAQAAAASGGALAAYAAGANGLDTGAHMSALHALVVAMRAALVANGIMS